VTEPPPRRLRRTAEEITDPEDRDQLLADLTTIPGTVRAR
jgi:hypothetical protein